MLAFVFIDSTAEGRSTLSAASSSTTTTILGGANGGKTSTTSPARAVEPKPLVIRIRASRETSKGTLIRRVEEALADFESDEERKRQFLVVLAYGGSDGVTRSAGESLASAVCDVLRRNWGRVDPRRTFFEKGDDGGMGYGYVTLKLFPISE